MRRVGLIRQPLFCFTGVLFGLGRAKTTYGDVESGSHGGSRVEHDVHLSSSTHDDMQMQTTRDMLVEQLSNEVFCRGNVHLKNVETLSSLPEGLHSFPEVCFVGRPNVGKSTLISCLLHNRRLGKGGATPGTTRLLQFFNVGDALLLVDTPGYGGWMGRHLSQKMADRANAFSILFRYLALRKEGNLKRVYWLVEASTTGSVVITPRDEEIITFLDRERIPFSVVLTKIDRHWRYFNDQLRQTAMVGKDGLMVDGHMARRGGRVLTPEEGVQRNIEDLCAFLGTHKVPIIGVCADRRMPNRSKNLVALQHDIVHYCSQELVRDGDVNLESLRELSYTPPTADDIQRVQLRYPVEAFVVPQDNNVSLEQMVAQHLEARDRFISTHASADFLSAKDVVSLHLQLGVGERGSTNDGDQPAGALCGASSVPAIEGSSEDPSGLAAKHSWVGPPTQGQILESGRAELVTEPLPLPVSLDPDADSVTAINGMRIPRSMISVSVEQLAISKDDELPAFALKSGAGAYEELLQTDYLPPSEQSPDVFVQHNARARLSEQEEVGLLSHHHTKSAARKRHERLLSKYIEKDKKDRSIYMQAEGYMCPWLAGAGQQRSTVMGMGEGHKPRGRSGALVRGLKTHGFGGKSLSLRTMKHRGRATKKTGSWAA